MKNLQEIKDSEGNSIKDIVAITTYLDGIVVGTKDKLYTNVTSLLKAQSLEGDNITEKI